jgi:hypothetical protein
VGTKNGNGGKLPPLPADAPGRPKDTRYREQYGVIVLCQDAGHQERIYNALRDLSEHPLRTKVVVT